MSAVLVALINALVAAIPEFATLIEGLVNKDDAAVASVKSILEPWPLDAQEASDQAKVDALNNPTSST